MLLKNIKYGTRNLRRDKFYSFINLLGLSIGMTAALLIFFWVKDEFSFDNFHQKGEDIYRIMTIWESAGEKDYISSTPYPLAEAAQANIPEVEAISLLMRQWNYTVKVDNQLLEFENGYLVPDDFLEMFDFPLIKGNKATAFSDPNSILLTETVANQLFGKADPIGKIINYQNVVDVKVTGILADLPSNSHLQFSCLLPLEGNILKFRNEQNLHWGNCSYYTYTQLQKGANIKAVEEKLTALIPAKQVERSAKEQARTLFVLQPLTDVYLKSDMLGWNSMPHGDAKAIRFVGLIGLLILLIACINYVNLSTARAAFRAKSTGIRKIVGASRMQLFNQFLTETTILVGIATVFSLMLTQLCLPLFAEFSGKNFAMAQLYSFQTLSIVGITALGTVILTGIQPALQLSAFKPVNVLRSSVFNGIGGKGGLRKALVVGQFVCSATLIMATIVVLNQLDFIRESKLGFEKEHIFTLLTGHKNLSIIKSELAKSPTVVDVTASDHNIYQVESQIGGTKWEGKTNDLPWGSYAFYVDENFKDFFGLEMAAGRWFNAGNRDSSSFMINETAAKAMGLNEPIGKWMEFNGVKGYIAGVLKDFHFRSMHEAIEPLILANRTDRFYRIQVKTTGKSAAAAIATAESLYQKHLPNQIFKYTFIDEAYNQLYTDEAKTAKLFGLFALLAILISCLGIFGLAAFTAQRRTKEIGVRKVLGASFNNLVLLLSKDFLKLVGIALFIAIPIAWWGMNDWLNNFAYRIEVKWWMFALTGLMLGSIAFLTVSYQSVKAALVNPVKSLKNE